MGILENVKVLESKVDKEIDLAKRLMEENDQLREKVDLYQKRVEDLESLIQAFKEEQNAIENGILSALNRLNQFEDAVEKKLAPLAAVQEPAEQAVSEPAEQAEEAAQPDGNGEALAADGEPDATASQPQNVTG
jgi:chromosome segregation ATPase